MGFATSARMVVPKKTTEKRGFLPMGNEWENDFSKMEKSKRYEDLHVHAQIIYKGLLEKIGDEIPQLHHIEIDDDVKTDIDNIKKDVDGFAQGFGKYEILELTQIIDDEIDQHLKIIKENTANSKQWDRYATWENFVYKLMLRINEFRNQYLKERYTETVPVYSFKIGNVLWNGKEFATDKYTYPVPSSHKKVTDMINVIGPKFEDAAQNDEIMEPMPSSDSDKGCFARFVKSTYARNENNEKILFKDFCQEHWKRPHNEIFQIKISGMRIVY